ncbi:hypothetical protein Ccrd_011073 [Cynara cardunculus var. scolymus]|uniref:Pathogen-related protein n=1 Tax=Cynara cardunculus var. scolymus TaxID=59895 RepID=A0A118K6E0_CYNCS|nr:hypothetical protein Ccrd_011073 [Cynara cardunculus var. scolymus]
MENLKLEEATKKAGEKYRSFLHEESENTVWRHGGPPNFDVVNQLFEEGRTKVGSYNALLKSTLPEQYQYYKAEQETFESSHDVFRSAFPRGFAWEVISVHSGPPVISYKFRHWGYFEGPFKGNAPTGEMVEFFGMGILKVDESLRAEDVEIYYDPADLISKLLKGSLISEHENGIADSSAANTGSCPFQKQA